MQTKLTLRLEESLIRHAKDEASARGTSVSKMVGDYLQSLNGKSGDPELSPVTLSFKGVMENNGEAEEAYKKHLRDKHL